MRLNQYIAATSGLSRRAADTAIQAGRVTIDHQPAALGQAVPDGALVHLDGQPLSAPADKHTYLILNKPVGYVSSHTRQGPDPTLYELLPPEYQRLRLVGRLDRDSSGLVLLTSDGQFVQHYAHPSGNKEKIYDLTLAKPLTPADLTHLQHGVDLEDGPSRVRIITTTGRHITLALGEGRNRQLRRTFGALGYSIDRLHRTQVGPFQLSNLPAGHWHTFTPATTETLA